MPGRKHQCDEIRVAEPPLGGGLGCRGNLAGFKTVEFGDIGEHHREIIGVGQEVLLKAGGQARECCVVFTEGGFGVVIQAGASNSELVEVAFHEVPRFGIEPTVCASGVHGRNSGEKSRIEGDRVGVRREQRCQSLLELIGEIVAVRGALIEKDVRHAFEKLAADFERNDSVRKGRLVGATGNRSDLTELVNKRFLKGRKVVCVRNFRKRRKSEGQRAQFEERVCHAFTLRGCPSGCHSRPRWAGIRWLRPLVLHGNGALSGHQNCGAIVQSHNGS